MMLTGPHEIVEDQDTSRKARYDGDKVEVVLLSDCSDSK